MVVGECSRRNSFGPGGKPIEQYGQAKARLMQRSASHVAMASQVLAPTGALHSVSGICGENPDMSFANDVGVVVPVGVFDEALARCRHIAEYHTGGCLSVGQ